MTDWDKSCQEKQDSIELWKQSCEFYMNLEKNTPKSGCQSGQMGLPAKQLDYRWFESNSRLQKLHNCDQ
jgi:hypothetical protein